MNDEAIVCAAAYFRSVGKDVTTQEEFVMSTSLELKWMSPSDAKLMLRMLLAENILTQKGEFIRPSSDLSGLDVPLAYRPSAELINLIHSRPAQAPASAPAAPKETAPDMFQTLVKLAESGGIQKKDFVPLCSRIQRKIGIDIAVAALIVLRDNKVDISAVSGDVYDYIKSN